VYGIWLLGEHYPVPVPSLPWSTESGYWESTTLSQTHPFLGYPFTALPLLNDGTCHRLSPLCTGYWVPTDRRVHVNVRTVSSFSLPLSLGDRPPHPDQVRNHLLRRQHLLQERYVLYEAIQGENAELCCIFHNACSGLYSPPVLEIVLHISWSG